MPRPSKIDKCGLGDKVLGLSLGGTTGADIVSRVNREHPDAKLTLSNVQDYLEKHEERIRNRRNESLNNALVMSLESVQTTLLETIGEIRDYLEEYKDDPRHAAAFLKLKLDAIEKMTKMLGGYPSERPQVAVQVNVVNSGEEFQRSVKAAEEYFATIEAHPVGEGADIRDGAQ